MKLRSVSGEGGEEEEEKKKVTEVLDARGSNTSDIKGIRRIELDWRKGTGGDN